MSFTRDPFGLRRLYYRPRDGRAAPTIAALHRGLPLALDPLGVAPHLDAPGTPPADPSRTCFEHVRAVPPGHSLATAPDGTRHIEPGPAPALLPRDTPCAALVSALQHALPGAALALSGGLDSALLLALLVRHAAPSELPPVYTLAPVDLPGYSELDRTREAARALGVPLIEVPVTAEQLVAALPDAVAAIECPLYNLHPVARFVLAQRLARDGVTAVITGDGADQAFAGTDGSDYLPLVAALCDAHNVALRAPFLDDAVVAHARLAVDPDKRALRALARDLVPAPLAAAPKRAGYAPPLDVSRHATAAELAWIASLLGRASPEMRTDRERVAWTSLALLVRHAERAW